MKDSLITKDNWFHIKHSDKHVINLDDSEDSPSPDIHGNKTTFAPVNGDPFSNTIGSPKVVPMNAAYPSLDEQKGTFRKDNETHGNSKEMHSKTGNNDSEWAQLKSG